MVIATREPFSPKDCWFCERCDLPVAMMLLRVSTWFIIVPLAMILPLQIIFSKRGVICAARRAGALEARGGLEPPAPPAPPTSPAEYLQRVRTTYFTPHNNSIINGIRSHERWLVYIKRYSRLQGAKTAVISKQLAVAAAWGERRDASLGLPLERAGPCRGARRPASRPRLGCHLSPAAFKPPH
ncbi:hypothetical protein EVAR_80522_1 [Eumeta japonica]|uniref:Uncharacterized protein n=1 Tax=Eumeta variegata TaxID=151549 RepID=A0A4C1TLG3_EUMVA|nr:hypothetical protein EVAR_80522_1 [Eumeta japonica]